MSGGDFMALHSCLVHTDVSSLFLVLCNISVKIPSKLIMIDD